MPRICKIAQMDKLSYRSVGFNRIPDAANLFVRVFQLHVTEIEFPLRGFHVRQDFREIPSGFLNGMQLYVLQIVHGLGIHFQSTVCLKILLCIIS